MPFKPGDVVKYVAASNAELHEVIGRVCQRQGTLFLWVRFVGGAGCRLVRESSLRSASGNAPSCANCPP